MDKKRLASFATVSPDMEPHAAPVFFTYENRKVYIQTDRNRLKLETS